MFAASKYVCTLFSLPSLQFLFDEAQFIMLQFVDKGEKNCFSQLPRELISPGEKKVLRCRFVWLGKINCAISLKDFFCEFVWSSGEGGNLKCLRIKLKCYCCTFKSLKMIFELLLNGQKTWQHSQVFRKGFSSFVFFKLLTQQKKQKKVSKGLKWWRRRERNQPDLFHY